MQTAAASQETVKHFAQCHDPIEVADPSRLCSSHPECGSFGPETPDFSFAIGTWCLNACDVILPQEVARRQVMGNQVAVDGTTP